MTNRSLPSLNRYLPRYNTLFPPKHPSVRERHAAQKITLSGDEIMARVMASHAAHIPTHQAIIDANMPATLQLLTRRLIILHRHQPSSKVRRITDLIR